MKRTVFWGLALVMFLTGCGPAIIQARRTAFGGGPYVPSRSGAPLEGGDFRLTGEVNSLLLSGPETRASCEDDSPGLWIPKLQLGGSVFAAAFDWLELGLLGRFTRLGWAEKCNDCVEEFSDQNRSEVVWSAGVSARYNQRFSDLVFVSAILELGLGTIYEEINGKVETDFVPHFGLFVQGGAQILPSLTLYGLLGLESLRSNRRDETGMNNPHDAEDSNDNFAYSVVPIGVGAEYRKDYFNVNAVLYYPAVVGQEITFGAAAFLQAGVTL